MPLKDGAEAIPHAQRTLAEMERSGQALEQAGIPATPYARYMHRPGFVRVGRNPGHGPESDWERQMYVVEPGNLAPRDHAWATARFAAEAMAEHAAILAVLMPPETARPQRERAILLGKQYRRLAQHLDLQGSPPAGEVRAFARQMGDELSAILAFKQECQDLQADGELRSLVWPSLLDHMRREAEHFEDRLALIGGGEVAVETRVAAGFWGHVLGEHARFVAHLLDPAEQRLVRQALRQADSLQATTGPLVAEGGRAQPAEAAGAVLEMAQEALEWMTETARGVEAARIQGLLAPLLVEHWRRETVWAVHELRRAQA